MLGVEAPVGNHNNHGQVLHLGVNWRKRKLWAPTGGA